ncbi:uncharacterized protein PFLUO_LOCUS1253 [Penicillium psychrofluorescens]|uniref:uncharacterized protein n=1 Tax=Penicillium psychrofluorescens TaxID=3158075 RepID=UPI003CCE057F
MYDINVPNAEFGAATVRIAFPPASLLKFPPAAYPETIPAPHTTHPTWRQPFNIPNDLYTQVLDVRVPITIASVYAITVVLINRLNKRRGYKPYAFSNTQLFKLFVVLHNVFLAIYSAWTFAGMLRAFSTTLPDRDDPHGLVGVVDSLCKINGQRGYGNAATYSPVTNEWSSPNPALNLTNGLPGADAGRLWNEGLAYFGWIFYLSKFYEVVDTAIILAKGKKSSTLQTYHHAGAMMCMWAGIRYVAAPIWIFALVNSGIHAMMYTYYTLTALRVRVPQAVKRSLTTMQITQFVLGTNMAAAYLFVHYTIPYPSGGSALRHLSKATTAASSPSAEASAGSWWKRIGQASPSGYTQQMVTCMDTTGQAFATWLNITYLLPLTYLFVRFFVRSYLIRTDSRIKQPTHMEAAEKAGMDALKSLSREIQKAAIEGENSEVTDDEVVRAHVINAAQKIAGVESSPARTRLSGANNTAATSASRSESEDGFSAVPAKKGAKKQTRSKKVTSNGNAKGENPFGVLDNDA